MTHFEQGNTPSGLSDPTVLRSMLDFDEGVHSSEPVLRLTIVFILCSFLYLRSFSYKRIGFC